MSPLWAFAGAGARGAGCLSGDKGSGAAGGFVVYWALSTTRKEPAMKYVCQVCGYVYDPAENDNIPFEQLPDDWVCPTCGVGKADFAPAE